MQNLHSLSFGDFLAVQYTSSQDDLPNWYAKRRHLDEGTLASLSSKAHEATRAADKASESAHGAAGQDVSKHPAAHAHAIAYDAHRRAFRHHNMDHRKTGNEQSLKTANKHRDMMRYHKDHLVALGAIAEGANIEEDAHVIRFTDIKQPPVAKSVAHQSKVDNVSAMQHNCPLCAKLGKRHSIINHLRENTFTETIDESRKDPYHTVSIGYDMPNHENRFERFTGRHVDVRVRASSKEEAIQKAHKHVEKKGHRVLHSFHIGQEPLKEATQEPKGLSAGQKIKSNELKALGYSRQRLSGPSSSEWKHSDGHRIYVAHNPDGSVSHVKSLGKRSAEQQHNASRYRVIPNDPGSHD